MPMHLQTSFNVGLILGTALKWLRNVAGLVHKGEGTYPVGGQKGHYQELKLETMDMRACMEDTRQKRADTAVGQSGLVESRFAYVCIKTSVCDIV